MDNKKKRMDVKKWVIVLVFLALALAVSCERPLAGKAGETVDTSTMELIAEWNFEGNLEGEASLQPRLEVIPSSSPLSIAYGEDLSAPVPLNHWLDFPSTSELHPGLAEVLETSTQPLFLRSADDFSVAGWFYLQENTQGILVWQGGNFISPPGDTNLEEFSLKVERDDDDAPFLSFQLRDDGTKDYWTSLGPASSSLNEGFSFSRGTSNCLVVQSSSSGGSAFWLLKAGGVWSAETAGTGGSCDYILGSDGGAENTVALGSAVVENIYTDLYIGPCPPPSSESWEPIVSCNEDSPNNFLFWRDNRRGANVHQLNLTIPLVNTGWHHFILRLKDLADRGARDTTGAREMVDASLTVQKLGDEVPTSVAADNALHGIRRSNWDPRLFVRGRTIFGGYPFRGKVAQLQVFDTWLSDEEVASDSNICGDALLDGSCSAAGKDFVQCIFGGDIWTGEEQCDDGNILNNDACTAACELVRCGDGFLYEGTEQCDDRNTELGDGCNAECQFEESVVCSENGHVCLFAQPLRGDPPLTVQAKAFYWKEQEVSFLWTSRDPTSIFSAGQTFTHTYSVPGPKELYAYVLGGEGSFVFVPIDVLTTCGDGYTAYGEECDDRNDESTDSCLTIMNSPAASSEFLCRWASCGDGYVQPLGKDGISGTVDDEQCDDGQRCRLMSSISCVSDADCRGGRFSFDTCVPQSNDGCSATCRLEYCGDGITNNNGNEACDDGDDLNTNACKTDCTQGTCGDGILQRVLGEECEDRNLIDGDACTNSCTLKVCGDGVLAGYCYISGEITTDNTAECALKSGTWIYREEQCDDNNNDNGDGCSAWCAIEYCGDGKVNQGEVCDDGNRLNSDGCSNSCLANYCGDGLLNNDEECDDGNHDEEDACTSSCLVNVPGDGIPGGGGDDGVLGTEDDEQCDFGPGNRDDGACTTQGRWALCGDSLRRTYDLTPADKVFEECDDGMLNSDTTPNACRSDCRRYDCGDSVVDAGEECDEGGLNSESGSCIISACTKAVCGDGFWQIGVEACDDGDERNDNACINACVPASCGDGYVQPLGADGIFSADDEQCDDNNGRSADGCDSLCRNEVVGNSIVGYSDPNNDAIFTLEQCDDGNVRDGDSCTAQGRWDRDRDTVPDEADNCPRTSNGDQTNGDGDIWGNACDACPVIFSSSQKDTDGDGTADACDQCPYDSTKTTGTCYACPENSPLVDGYRMLWSASNIRVSPSPLQSKNVGGLGSISFYPFLEDKSVIDQVKFYKDKAPTEGADQTEENAPWDVGGGSATLATQVTLVSGQHAITASILTTGGSTLSLCTSFCVGVADSDSDGLCDTFDNCPAASNANQIDTDRDSIGNACDTDDDGDNFVDEVDNCPLAKNPGQENGDGDDKGDACDVQTCGNGIIETPGTTLGVTDEVCDDGNRNWGDGCSASCAIEELFLCTPKLVPQVSGTTNSLLAIDYYHQKFGVAAGSGVLLSTSSGGVDLPELPFDGWQKSTSTSTLTSLPQFFDVQYAAPFTSTSNRKIWAVGAGGKIILWESSTPAEQASGTTVDLKGVYFTSSTSGWAIGYVTDLGGVTSDIVKTIDGVTWSSVRKEKPGKEWEDVFFLDANTGWIAGKSSSGVILKTDTAGSTWTEIPVPTAKLFAVQFTDQITGWVIGSTGIFRTLDGEVWNRQLSTSGIIGGDLSFLDGQRGWALLKKAAGSEVYFTRDGGVHWWLMASGLSLNSLEMVKENVGWMVGDGGQIYTMQGPTTCYSPDSDGDGRTDVRDNCQLQANPGQENRDGDGLGNACDPDDDNDGICDGAVSLEEICTGSGLGDNCPLIKNGAENSATCDPNGDRTLKDAEKRECNQIDTDFDRKGDACESDDDGDGISDRFDAFPTDSKETMDRPDGDGIGNNADPDDDNDGTLDSADCAPLNAAVWRNQAYPDHDEDEIPNALALSTVDCFGRNVPEKYTVQPFPLDNCLLEYNQDQADTDADAVGDACDLCPSITDPLQTDADGDKIGNACDLCPAVADPLQSDFDTDNIGDVCDNAPLDTNADQADGDGDGIGDVADSCPTIANPLQEDLNSDGFGDACAPVIDTFTAKPLSMYIPPLPVGETALVFLNASAHDPDGGAITFFWDSLFFRSFDPDNYLVPVTEGVQQEGVPEYFGAYAYQYSQAGSDTLTLTVRDDEGSVSSSLIDISLLSCGDSELYAGTDGIAGTKDMNEEQCDEGTDCTDGICNSDSTSGACRSDCQAARCGDGVVDSTEECDGAVDAGGDAICTVDCTFDRDGDGVTDAADNCPNDANSDQLDTDRDMVGDACDSCSNDAANDADNDGICGDVDTCPEVANVEQTNSDDDSLGDACDLDDDNDGRCDQSGAGEACAVVDNCPSIKNGAAEAVTCDPNLDGLLKEAEIRECEWINSDTDLNGDACDPDDDSDGVLDVADNCPLIANGGQENNDQPLLMQVLGAAGSAPGQFLNPAGVAEDSSGNLYVVEHGNDRIQVFDSAGNFLRTWGTLGVGNSLFKNPSDLAFDLSGNVYVVDTNNNRIQKFTSSGTFITKWGTFGSANGQFITPVGITIDEAEYVYVPDNNRVQVFDSAGIFVRSWDSTGSGNGQFLNPRGITYARGEIYVVEDGNDRVQVFDTAGRFLRMWSLWVPEAGQTVPPSPEDVAVDGAGFVYVSDSRNHQVLVFDQAGNFQRVWGIFGSGESQFNSPKGLALTSYGQIVVADFNNHRLQFVSLTNEEGDACDPDDDNDGRSDGLDNCPFTFNPTQDNGDDDAFGDACDVQTCGDGTRQAPLSSTGTEEDGWTFDEQCDDGNTNNIDTCLNTCLVAVCGDGFIQQGVEECDEGTDCTDGVCNSDSTPDACRTSCLLPFCGDGLVNPLAGEACEGDTFCTSCQADRDDDGLADTQDPCPDDPPNDADGDGVCEQEDACPLDSRKSATIGRCGCGVDDLIADIDADSLCGNNDPCPDDRENDQDRDGFCESVDNCPSLANDQRNTDGDAFSNSDTRTGGDACDLDDDGDLVSDDQDCAPLDGRHFQLLQVYQDIDHDGFTQDTIGTPVCLLLSELMPAQSLTTAGKDCDDSSAVISPAAEEMCDRVDNDCDGSTDEEENLCPVAQTCSAGSCIYRLGDVNLDGLRNQIDVQALVQHVVGTVLLSGDVLAVANVDCSSNLAINVLDVITLIRMGELLPMKCG